VNTVALGQVFSEYFGFPCQFSFHRLLHIHHHLSSGVGTIGQLVAEVLTGLNLTPAQETNPEKLRIITQKEEEMLVDREDDGRIISETERDNKVNLEVDVDRQMVRIWMEAVVG
jgi:hypothetical protein